MASQYSFNHKKADYYIHPIAAVMRSGNDRLQNDMIDLMMSRNNVVTKEEAITILETYASAFERILNRRDIAMFSESRMPDMLPAYQDNNFSYTPVASHSQTEHESIDTPVLSHCYNVVSNTRTIMPGCIVRLHGTFLEFDRTDAKQGVFLIDQKTNIVVKVTALVRIKPENVIFMVPDGLTAGNYKLELRNRCQHSRELLTGTLPGVVNVAI